MDKAKVYFTDMRTTFEENLPQKLTRLLKTAGIGQIDFRGKFVAIKIHFGEPGQLLRQILPPAGAAEIRKIHL